MSKVKDGLPREVRNQLPNAAASIGFLFAAPSNVEQNQLYDAGFYRTRIKNDDSDVRAILDNNIVTQVLGLLDPSRPVRPDEDKIVCTIMTFLTYSNIQTIPNIALYEQPIKSTSLCRQELDECFRVADHIHPRYWAAVAFGEQQALNQDGINNARREITNNAFTQQNIGQNTYTESTREPRANIFLALAKAWELKRFESDENLRIGKFMSWYRETALFCDLILTACLRCLGNNVQGTLIKRANNQKSDVIIASIENASWDIYYLQSWRDLYTKYKDTVWLLCTRDRALCDLADKAFTFDTAERALDAIADWFHCDIDAQFCDHFARLQRYQKQIDYPDVLKAKESELLNKKRTATEKIKNLLGNENNS